jgi:hypothetical protein
MPRCSQLSLHELVEKLAPVLVPADPVETVVSNLADPFVELEHALAPVGAFENCCPDARCFVGCSVPDVDHWSPALIRPK